MLKGSCLHMDRHNKKGFTLSELMIASLILAVTLVGMIGLITNLVALNETNRSLLIAALHGQHILETIKDSGRPSQIEARVNAGQWNLSEAELSATPYNLSALPGETITTAIFQSGNPCGIAVMVSWFDHTQRGRSLVLNTLVAE